ncbi:MAG: hypothetical protein CVU11_12055 [Bacteroidetes bacterium HGW-Bacteroidetes-6]|jgi:hypothetical protein|nr:MAG: hypothetical protein CVU11_12055 [Bacteroidetes bacterium HGW-Bacteroidetes-6]
MHLYFVNLFIFAKKISMKKSIFIISILAVFAFSSALAQNLTISDASGVLAPNAYIYVWGDSGTYTTIEAHLSVTNNSVSNLDVKLKKAEVSVVSGTENSFCWGQCYIPSVFVSPDPLTIDAGTTNTGGFLGEYKPKGILGVSTIRYTFYDSNNVNDSVAVYVVYGATPASIAIKPVTIEFSNAFPNPATSVVSFNYDLQSVQGYGELVITDLLGGEMLVSPLSNDKGKLSVDVSGFTGGVYFYSLRVDGKSQFTRKLIVRH